MAWSSPFTAVAGSAYTAAQHNQYVRDNFLETAPAKASAAGQHFVSTGVNVIIQRSVNTASVSTQETTTSTSMTDLATVGPDLFSQQLGAKAMFFVSANVSNNTLAAYASTDFDLSGATTRTATTSTALVMRAGAANQDIRATAVTVITSLTPGSHAMRQKYVVTAGTGAFANRHVTVVPWS
jgi:hypothetical protein